MALIGYSLGIYDSKSYMNSNMWGVDIFGCLDHVKNRYLHLNPNFKLKNRRADISVTYDSFVIVSTRFKEFCIDNNYQGVSFYDLTNYNDRFYMEIFNVVSVDTKRREIDYYEYNSVCNEYNEVIGAHPVCLVNKSPLDKGFYRTDIEFGRGYAKSAIEIVDIETGKKLKAEKFKGLYLDEILTEYDFEKVKK
jgi:hypothetical protein